MPVIATREGWVRVKPQAKKAKPADPLAPFRGPLAYITGTSDTRQPLRKPLVTQQRMIESAQPRPRGHSRSPPRSASCPTAPSPTEPQPARPHRPRSGMHAAPRVGRSRKVPTETFEEADEEILRMDTHSVAKYQRSASPACSRHSRPLPATSSRHIPSLATCHNDQEEHGFYAHQNTWSEHNLAKERRHRMAESQHYSKHYTPIPPTLQPIVIYTTPPATSGCGSFYHDYHHSCQPFPRPQIQSVLPQMGSRFGNAPRPTPSLTSSRSGDSKTSHALSYQWYSATQPLNM